MCGFADQFNPDPTPRIVEASPRMTTMVTAFIGGRNRPTITLSSLPGHSDTTTLRIEGDEGQINLLCTPDGLERLTDVLAAHRASRAPSTRPEAA